MSKTKVSVVVPKEEIEKQKSFEKQVNTLLNERCFMPKAFVRTFGCQQNVSDSQRMKGMLLEMGYVMTEQVEDADLVLYNTCAVREHAEDRVIGNVGALKHHKRRRPGCVIALCGCMMQQKHIAEKIKNSFSHVDLVFGTHVIHRLPEMIFDVLSKKKRVFQIPDADGIIAEGLPVCNDGGARGWLPVMYGCNNFCTYCVVPYVRGRERSREPDKIIDEAKEMIAAGIKDITLLGQNVNSYDAGIGFPELLRRINALDGDFRIRFMTSHPKDCGEELLTVMAECQKVCRHLHLPVQSGSDRVLHAMNRKYTSEKYLGLIKTARRLMPDIKITSDIIVGFPGETYDEFLETVKLIETVRYTSLYTFIFSARENTPAASMDDPVSAEDKGIWFRELLAKQEGVAGAENAKLEETCMRVLVEEANEKNQTLIGRTEGNQTVEFSGDLSLIGNFAEVEITEALTWILKGKLI